LEDADAYEYSNGEVDLSLALRDAILLEIPIRHLCADDCRSLCPVCGKDLNEGDCGCEQRIADPRFEALRGMFSTSDGDEQ
jgi:uncharacterized protein